MYIRERNRPAPGQERCAHAAAAPLPSGLLLPAVPTTSYLGDGALVAIDGGPGYTLGQRRFFHGDLIGSTRLLTDGTGAVSQSLAYTAFGEPLGAFPASTPRCGYAGAWGYQSDATDGSGNPLIGDSTLPFSYGHVGARYYAPALGRFTLRDPIGILGGLNVYEYAFGQPIVHTDPAGRAGLPEVNLVALAQSIIVRITLGGYAAMSATIRQADRLAEYSYQLAARYPGVSRYAEAAAQAIREGIRWVNQGGCRLN